MNEFPSLAEIIDKHTPSGSEGNVQCWCNENFDSFREHAEHIAQAWREACTITTVEHLDALPVAAVIKLGDLPGGLYEKDRKGSWGFGCWGDEYQQIIISAELEALTIHLVWHPDWARP